jgi:hypothetical protein
MRGAAIATVPNNNSNRDQPKSRGGAKQARVAPSCAIGAKHEKDRVTIRGSQLHASSAQAAVLHP